MKTTTLSRIVACIFVVACSLTLSARKYADESLDYKVMYKWGLVHKQAGHATLSLRNRGNEYHTMLTAASEKWADRFYKVRDTLEGRIERATFRPRHYEKRSHEGGDHKHDVVVYDYNGNSVTGSCIRRAWDKKGKLKTDETRRLTAEGVTIDMLSSFYYMRDLPYETYQPGHKTVVNLFSGKRKEILTIKYLGRQNVEVGKKTYQCYHISFNFTEPGKKGKESSDPMEAWISTGDQRIPIKLSGKLKVGAVHCVYNPR